MKNSWITSTFCRFSRHQSMPPPPNSSVHNLLSSKTHRIWSKLNSFQRAQNRGTVSRPRLLFLIPVAIALGSRPLLSRFCPWRSSPRKWDSHLNTLRQSRVGPRDTARRTVLQKETRIECSTLARLCSRKGRRDTSRLRREGEGERGRDERRRKGTRDTRSRCPCPSMFSLRTGFVGCAWSTGHRFSVIHDLQFSSCVYIYTRIVNRNRDRAMIGIRATRPTPLRFLHCGRDFCRVCRYTTLDLWLIPFEESLWCISLSVVSALHSWIVD